MRQVQNLILLVAAVTIAAGLALAKDAAAEVKWKMATSWGGGPLMEIGAKALAQKIEFQVRYDFTHEGRAQLQSPRAVTQMIGQKGQGQLRWLSPLVGPLEAVLREFLEFIPLVEGLAVDQHLDAVDGARTRVGRHKAFRHSRIADISQVCYSAIWGM